MGTGFSKASADSRNRSLQYRGCHLGGTIEEQVLDASSIRSRFILCRPLRDHGVGSVENHKPPETEGASAG